MSAYLFGVFVFLLLWLIIYFLKPRTRKLQIFGSLMLLPFAILDIWFRPNYWNPPLLIKAIEPFSIESLLYCFAVGGIAIVFGNLFIKKEFKFRNVSPKKVLIFFLSSFILYFLFSVFTNFSAMNNLNYSFLIIWLFLFLFNFKDNWRSLIPAPILALITILAVNLGLLVYPGFVAEYWNLNRLWPLFLNTPTEEIFFAGVLASLWTLLPKYLIKKK